MQHCSLCQYNYKERNLKWKKYPDMAHITEKKCPVCGHLQILINGNPVEQCKHETFKQFCERRALETQQLLKKIIKFEKENSKQIKNDRRKIIY